MKDAPWVGMCREDWEEVGMQIFKDEEDEDEPVQSDR